MMIKLSVSQAARILGISRFDIQNQINNGKLQTHEGYVTTDSLRLAYPNLCCDSEQDERLAKMQQIKNNAMFKDYSKGAVRNENEKVLLGIISSLKTGLSQEKIKNQHYEMVFAELGERLDEMERCCHSQDKKPLKKLQSWVNQQTH